MFGSTPPWAIVTPDSSLFSSSSFLMASWTCLGMIRVFLLSRAALPADRKANEEEERSRLVKNIHTSKVNPTHTYPTQEPQRPSTRALRPGRPEHHHQYGRSSDPFSGYGESCRPVRRTQREREHAISRHPFKAHTHTEIPNWHNQKAAAKLANHRTQITSPNLQGTAGRHATNGTSPCPSLYRLYHDRTC